MTTSLLNNKVKSQVMVCQNWGWEKTNSSKVKWYHEENDIIITAETKKDHDIFLTIVTMILRIHVLLQ
jgi:hypothetical protein